MLFEWIADNLNVYMMGPGTNIIQFLHSGDLAECCFLASRQKSSGIYNVGGKTCGPLREDLSFLLEHAKSTSKLVSLPIGPTRVALRLLDWIGLSPLGPFHYLTYAHSFYVTNAKAKRELGWEPANGNREILAGAYDSFVAGRHELSKAYGSTHRKSLRQGVLRTINRLLS
jgi:nucleoside-diphosphate-sugar epimerase